MDACTGIEHDHGPKPGSITVCIKCGHVMAFGENLEMVPLNDEQMEWVAGNPLILRIQKARAAAMTKVNQ
jgi:hypothetical protein